MSTKVFHCTAGLTFAVADAHADVFLCSNFMHGQQGIRLGNLYQGLRLRTALFPCGETFCICPQYRFDPALHANAVEPQRPGMSRPPYGLWLHWYVTDECFLSCTYCASGNRPFVKANVRPIEIEALLRTLASTGQTVHLSFTGGGEPFAVPNMSEACAALTREHFISFNSNLLGVHMERFLAAIDPRRILYIQASAHLQELDRTGSTDRFVRNIKALREAGIEVNPVAVGIPSIIPEVPRWRARLAKDEIAFTFAPFSGVYEGRHYPDAYSQAELEALGLTEAAAQVHRIAEDPRQ